MESVLVKLRTSRHAAYYDPRGHHYRTGQCLILEVEKFRDYGTVVLGNHELDSAYNARILPHVLREANSFDLKKIDENRERERRAYRYCRNRIDQLKLDMKLVEAQFFFDRRKLKFLFTSWDKVDFRQLVRDLASEFKTGVELRQIGVRDAAKILGGIGVCGRVTCCDSFLEEFPPINLKMARIQERSSNPEKISGICGRLRCCLRYEYEQYLESYRESGKDVDDPALFQGIRDKADGFQNGEVAGDSE